MIPKSKTYRITDVMWTNTEAIYEEILLHPFIKGLTSGELDRSSFEFYTIQDALYLKDYARALSLAAAKSEAEEHIILFNEHSKGCLIEERAMQENFFDVFGLSSQEIWKTPKAPVCQAYTSYLLSVAYSRPFHEILAAVLPCYWIYWEVGKALASKGSSDPMYQQWIDTYAGDSFAECVLAIIDLTNQIALDLPSHTQQEMLNHYVITSRYEWMFWDMGYRKEIWPV
tara:strand:+ start:92748 stop:93431 length:684 start_codon:yes stop_codon:yes gene_type:complete